MLLNRVLAVFLLALSPAVFADHLDINLNNNAAQFQFSSSEMVEGISGTHAGVLYNDRNNLFFDAGVLAKEGEENAPGLSIGVGAKAVFGTINTPGVGGAASKVNTVSGIGVGGELTYTLPTPTPVAIVGEYYASPKIMSFADSERYNQFGVRLEIEASPQAGVYVGYREIGFGIKQSGSLTLDNGTVLGARLKF
jgi:hypothetical protein